MPSWLEQADSNASVEKGFIRIDQQTPEISPFQCWQPKISSENWPLDGKKLHFFHQEASFWMNFLVANTKTAISLVYVDEF